MLTTDQIKTFLAGRGATHMPYPVPGGPFLFCDATGDGGWRAMRWDGVGDAVPLMDAPPAGGSQCTPVGVVVDGALAWSVCATYPGSFAIHTHAGEITGTAGAGFNVAGRVLTTKKMVVFDDPAGPYMATFIRDGGNVYRMAAGRQILAATPTAAGVLLTTYTPTESNRAFLLESGHVYELTLPDGSAPYKPALFAGGVFHATQTGPGWEDRRVVFSDTFTKNQIEPGGVMAPMAAMPTVRQLRGRQ